MAFQRPGATVDIVPYRPEYREAFERLNRRWLETHSLLEPVDLEYLQNPEERILAAGGEVFFAVERGIVLGSCAAICLKPFTIELAKLAVAPEAQGRGLGRRLCQRVIEFARNAGAREVVLTSNSALAVAIRLYESLGFSHVPLPPDVPYLTADVYMTLRLEES